MDEYESMHILHVLECFVGGSKEVVRMLCSHQIQSGHRVTLVCGLNGGALRSELAHFPEQVHVISVDSWGDRGLVSSVRAMLALRRAVRTRRPDVVHLHSSIAGFVGRLGLSVRRRSTVFYTPHGISLQRPGVSRLSYWAYSLAERVANVFHPASYVACSASEYDRLRAWNPALRLLQIENGIEQLNAVACDGTDRSEFLFVSVGRLSAQKNQAELIALKNATGVDIAVLGDGDAALRSELEGAGISVSGWLAKHEIVGVLSQQRIVLVQPSLSEGLPIAVLEAFCLGVPVIARTCPGHVDVIRNGENGFLYSTTAELVELVANLSPDDPRLSEIAQKAQSEFGQRYTAHRMGADYLDAYAQVLSR